jgi:hypothetical protein
MNPIALPNLVRRLDLSDRLQAHLRLERPRVDLAFRCAHFSASFGSAASLNYCPILGVHYTKLSEKLEKLIEQHRDNWKSLSDDLEQLRKEAIEGRTDAVEGLTKEATTFYDYVLQLAYDGGKVPAEDRPPLKKLMLRIVEMLQDTIGVLDFWKKPIEVKKLRGNIDTEILLANIPALNARHERLAVEIVKLAEKRDADLRRGLIE